MALNGACAFELPNDLQDKFNQIYQLITTKHQDEALEIRDALKEPEQQLLEQFLRLKMSESSARSAQAKKAAEDYKKEAEQARREAAVSAQKIKGYDARLKEIDRLEADLLNGNANRLVDGMKDHKKGKKGGCLVM